MFCSNFNVRGQLYDVRLSTQSWTQNELDGDRGALVNYYSNQNFTPGFTGTDNNGNLTRQETYIPGSGFFQDNFAYDSLNRLTSISEKVNGAGSDTLIEADNADFVLTNTALTGVGNDTLSGFEQAQLTGGVGNNVGHRGELNTGDRRDRGGVDPTDATGPEQPDGQW